MVDLIRSSLFDGWLTGLRDRHAKVRIVARLDRLAVGSPGDVKPVGSGISELAYQLRPRLKGLLYDAQNRVDRFALWW